jgi:hypothetical protein
MNTALTSVILLLALVAIVLLGRSVRRRLPDHHLSAESKDAVKLALDSLVAGAVSVAGAVFLIMELDQPLGGLIRISRAPMLKALSQFGK